MSIDQSADRSTPVTQDAKRDVIHAAAIAEFSLRGFSATSMANIAEAAGMSRPALYRHFRNKSDIFGSAFIALLDGCANSALEALGAPGTIATHLDGFMQRFDGDLWEQMQASAHSEELLGVKNDDIAVGMLPILGRLEAGLGSYLKHVCPGTSAARSAQRADWVEVLRLSPKGLKLDQPSVEVYRRRLTALARSVAADIEQ